MPDPDAPSAGALLELRLGDWGPDGSARTRLPTGRELRVPGGVPGERARVRVTGSSGGAAVSWAELVEVLEPPSGGPVRRPPPCAIAERCGGCGLQHVEDAAQFPLKVRSAAALLPGPLREALVPPEDRLAAPRPFGYRHKAVLLPAIEDGRLVLGAFARGTHAVVDQPRCEVLAPALLAARGRLAEALAPELESGRLLPAPPGTAVPPGPSLRALVLRANRGGEVLVTFVVGDRRTKKRLRPLAATLVREGGPVKGAFMQVHRDAGDAVTGRGPALLLAGAARLIETIGGVPLELGPLTFFQVNPDLLELLVARAATWVPPGSRLLDLYCGGGALGLVCAEAAEAASCSGIELVPDSIAAARRTAQARGRAGRWAVGTPADLLPELEAAEGPFDVVLVDPPRSGCAPGDLAAVRAGSASRLIYVSCSTRSLARDAGELLASGWRPRALVPADMLPQTPHLEWLAVFDRPAGGP